MKIRINTGDWMLTMGMVGFHRVYNYGLAHNIIPENGNDLLKIHSIGFELNPDIFKYLPQAYFSYMLAEHSIYEREQERLRKSMGFAGKEENFNDALGNVKRIINDNTKKIVRYFPEEVTGRLDAAQTKLKEIKKFDQYSELKNCVSEFLEVAKLQEVDEKLTLNFVKAVILRPFFGQPSFINVSKNNLTLQEQIKLFRDDYVQPVLLELDFQECVDGAKDKKEILAFLEERKNYKPFATFLRQFKKLKYDEIKDIVENQTPQCSLLQNLPAYRNYEEMIFSPLGISTNKALNFQWKQNKNLPTPISSLAKLVLFCAPAGCALYGRWEGRGGQGEYRTYAGFVQAEGAFSDTIRRNNSFKNQKDKNDPFDKILGVLIEDLRQKAGHILEHLFFVEFFSDYESKKTALEYYHLPRFLAHYIKAHGKQLEKVTPRERFVRSVLLGQDPIYAVWSHLKWLIGKNHYTFGCYLAVRERNRILFFKKYLGKEGAELDKQDKRIWSVYKSGEDIRRGYERAESQREGETNYAAPAGKKINGVAYRLLNTVKAGNKEDFMDSLFRLHMSVGRPVNSVFLDALHEKKLDFASVGTAFIAGLLSSDRKKGRENDQ